MEVSPTVDRRSTGRFDVDGMSPLPRSWCATWFALTRHGGDGCGLEHLIASL